MKRRIPILIALCGLCAITGCRQAPPEPPSYQTGITYRRIAGTELQLDMAIPGDGSGPFPLVVCVHGGGWVAGERQSLHETMTALAKHGYVAATIQYRLAPMFQFPAQVEDVQAAIEFLCSLADESRIDPERIAVLGESAGGHLALLAGMMEEPKNRHRPGVVVNYYGSVDFQTWEPTPTNQAILRELLNRDLDELGRDFLGTTDRTHPIVATASPITHVKHGGPTVLSFHGDLDPLVPVQGSQRLHEALRNAGVTEKLVILEGAGHGWIGEDKKQTTQQMIRFLDANLKVAK